MDLGIGYITLFHERLSQVDFLSWMGQLEFVMVSARPKAVQSYTTLVRPLDMHSWCFLAGSSLMMVTMLYCIYWTASLKKSLHRGWSPTKSVRLPEKCSRADYLVFPAWMMPISFLLRESVPEHWLHWQQGAQAVNVACLVWLLATLVLSSGYSGTLLSSLMMNYYERPGCSSGKYDCMSRFYMLQEI